MEKEQFLKAVHSYIKLLSLYLNKKEAPDLEISENRFKFYEKLSSHHSLRAFLFQALKATKAHVNQEQLKELENYYFSTLRRSVLFDKERSELFKYLNNNEIDFLPLKGIILKEYYPDTYTREVADNDILFSSKDDMIKKYFKNRGYSVKLYRKSNHDVYMKKPFYNFEMHRALFEPREDNKKNVVYFKDYLNKTLVKQGHERYLKDENFYIYFTAHTYKHFHNSGCGIRTLVDYYLYLRNKQLDFNYINQELDQLEITDFSNKIKALSSKLFNDEPLNQEEEEMLLYIASSGTYGTIEHNAAKNIEEKGKFRYYMSRIFPPMSFYKKMYPWAYKTKVLIPLAWLIRFFRILFKNPKRAKAELKTIRKYKKEKKEDKVSKK